MKSYRDVGKMVHSAEQRRKQLELSAQLSWGGEPGPQKQDKQPGLGDPEAPTAFVSCKSRAGFCCMGTPSTRQATVGEGVECGCHSARVLIGCHFGKGLMTVFKSGAQNFT